MTGDQIQEQLRASPFRPFHVHLSDGRSFQVPHREFLWRHPTGRIVFIATGEDAYEVIDVLSITSLSVGNGQSTPPGGQNR